jgi:linoleoyl-CoA desaturase
MDENRKFTFQQKISSSDFSKVLAQRIDDYFLNRRISRRANLEMVSKTLLGFVSWIATYLWLLTGKLSSLGVIGVYVLHGFAQLHMGLNIAHDANHGAYAKGRWTNRALGYVFDLVGLSSYMWRLMHNDSHHFFVNVRGADTALGTGGILRFTPHDERKPFHRYQHLYAPFLYCLATLDWVLVKDYLWLFSPRFGNRRISRHPRHELVLLFAGKAFYYTYTLVLPLCLLSVPWYTVVLGFVVMHFFLGFTLALTFQPNHFTAGSSFPEPDESGHLSNDYIRHIFDTTVDYARGNPFAGWVLGGLNLHVVHHMFPGVCHVHYPALTRIIKSTAEEHGLLYRENRTLAGAFLAHLRWMKALGNGEESAQAEA